MFGVSWCVSAQLSEGILCLNLALIVRDFAFYRYLIVTLTSRLLQRLALEPAVLVTVQSTRGSVPREAGAWMAVFANAIAGTVGGGRQ